MKEQIKERIKEFLLKCIFTFVEPKEEYFYDGKKGEKDFKENLDEWRRWDNYHDGYNAYEIRARTRAALFIVVVASIIICLVIFTMRSCNAYESEYKATENAFQKELGDKKYSDRQMYYSTKIRNTISNQENVKVIILTDVLKNKPLILAEVEIDGCEYYLCFTDGCNETITSICHKGNCKSPVHK